MALWGPDGPPEGVFGRSDRWSTCAEDDGHDEEDCWGHVSPIREPVAIPPPNMLISRQEMQAIAMGYAPVGMADRWFAFMEDDRLFFHRSWTGYGIYEATFAATETGFVMISACVEGDPARCRPDPDLIEECDLLRDLIVLVAGEPTPLLSHAIMSRIPPLKQCWETSRTRMSTPSSTPPTGIWGTAAVSTARSTAPPAPNSCGTVERSAAVTLGGLWSPRASDSRLGGSFTPWRRSGPVALAASRCYWSRATANP